ncbi:hypothetical protein TWF694_004125 [Orbilia ellipsospora]|uniref:Uncharacterized protein n=1 Tax=Orbilia ellipsospora TaxID=2528407 RepID=A0AAV9WYF0_9PEZI
MLEGTIMEEFRNSLETSIDRLQPVLPSEEIPGLLTSRQRESNKLCSLDRFTESTLQKSLPRSSPSKLLGVLAQTTIKLKLLKPTLGYRTDKLSEVWREAPVVWGSGIRRTVS